MPFVITRRPSSWNSRIADDPDQPSCQQLLEEGARIGQGGAGIGLERFGDPLAERAQVTLLERLPDQAADRVETEHLLCLRVEQDQLGLEVSGDEACLR